MPIRSITIPMTSIGIPHSNVKLGNSCTKKAITSLPGEWSPKSQNQNPENKAKGIKG